LRKRAASGNTFLADNGFIPANPELAGLERWIGEAQ